MSPAKSRREMYSEATRTALLDTATELFAERGFTATSLEEVATSALLTRGAVYHHFASKKALFEAVLQRLGESVVQRVTAVVAEHDKPEQAALAGLDAYLSELRDPIYGKLIWQEGPLALGWDGWRRVEREYSYALVQSTVQALMADGYLPRIAEDTTTRLLYELVGGAGLAIAEAAPADTQRVRDECYELLRRLLVGLHEQA